LGNRSESDNNVSELLQSQESERQARELRAFLSESAQFFEVAVDEFQRVGQNRSFWLTDPQTLEMKSGLRRLIFELHTLSIHDEKLRQIWEGVLTSYGTTNLAAYALRDDNTPHKNAVFMHSLAHLSRSLLLANAYTSALRQGKDPETFETYRQHAAEFLSAETTDVRNVADVTNVVTSAPECAAQTASRTSALRRG
jgi:hypothetical protein